MPASPGPSLHQPLGSQPGIGPARQQQLSRAGFRSLGDVLHLLPIGYRDLSTVLTPSSVTTAGEQAVKGQLVKLRWVRRRGRRGSLVLGELTDGSSLISLLWPSQPWQKRRLEGLGEVVLFGKVEASKGGWRMLMPRLLDPDRASSEGPEAIYPDLPGLGAILAGRIRQTALSLLDQEEIEDWMPAAARLTGNSLSLSEALRSVHRPGLGESLEALLNFRTAAWQRLLWADLVLHQMHFCWRRQRRGRSGSVDHWPIAAVPPNVADSSLIARLPFQLTAAQIRAATEIVADLNRDRPMHRLLTGDVGCGKTVVLALAIEQVLARGQQVALMAPTEILAEQLFGNLVPLLSSRMRSGLLTSAAEDGAEVRRGLADGTVDLVIGTHALTHRSVRFDRLGLVVVDEQHRFGTDQRQALLRKGPGSSLLTTSATPIPRSLALAVFGDLDLTVIDELPPGRQPVCTEIVASTSRATVYRQVRARLESGEQAFIVMPRIEQGEAEGASLKVRAGQLGELLGGLPFAELTGRTPATRRREVLEAFAAGELSAVIATTVVEVGIDVPNASVMVIEGAERFGLAQLHQLRGRVGRGSKAAVCIAIHGRVTETGRQRLAAFKDCDDGFRLALADLEQRGAGELLGRRQSGTTSRAVSRAIADPELLRRARSCAEGLLADIPNQRPSALRRRLAACLWAERRSRTGG